ncbi:MAG TPA: FtsX-like permease family protein, partial [Candidatus Angelobacter sp.]
LSSWVGQRTREIGIRMALGAEKADVLKKVLGQGFRLITLGLILGVMGAVAASRFLTSLLFSVTAFDFEVFVATPLVVTMVAAVAAYLPARRATEVDPMVALRYE